MQTGYNRQGQGSNHGGANGRPAEAVFDPTRFILTLIGGENEKSKKAKNSSNKVYLNPQDVARLGVRDKIRVKSATNSVVHFAVRDDNCAVGTIGLSGPQRSVLGLTKDDVNSAELTVEAWTEDTQRNTSLVTLSLKVDIYGRKAEDLDEEAVEALMRETFGKETFCLKQVFIGQVSSYSSSVWTKITIERLYVADVGASKSLDARDSLDGMRAVKEGLLTDLTNILITPASNPLIKWQPRSKAAMLFSTPNWSGEDMGIGGLDGEFADIFRRAFASRLYPPKIIKELGINHVRGMLLWGPPGTGKTLIARQIGKMLNGNEPTVVDGPSILNKYVGQSEENIRQLFVKAEEDLAENGDRAQLHIVIFDEIDAICKKRGSSNSGTNVGDTVVNQLLAKIDGVNALENVLIIGMTNRKDMLDDALLRPGRLEVHIEIGLPDEGGREQIFRIHTKKMKEAGYLDEKVDMKWLASVTKNYSGAEIEGVVKSATSFAMNKIIDPSNLKATTSNLKKMKEIRIQRDAFEHALGEVRAAFGVDEEELDMFEDNKILRFSDAMESLISRTEKVVEGLQKSKRMNLLSVLLRGPSGTGKTSLAVHLAKYAGFPYIKVISPDKYIGTHEQVKCAMIDRVFNDAYKSKKSIIILDDIERLLNYVPIGPRFSNVVLQTILVLIRKKPPKNRKLLVLATTSLDILEDLQMEGNFMSINEIPKVNSSEAFKKAIQQNGTNIDAGDLDKISEEYSHSMGVKKLLDILDMAEEDGRCTYETVREAMDDFNVYDDM